MSQAEVGVQPPAAAVWTGLITTAANRLGETTALGKMSSSEASVLLATEPLFAALFAAWLLGEALGWNDGAGGALIVGACLCNAASPEQVRSLLGLAAPPPPTEAAAGASTSAEQAADGVATAVAASVAEAKQERHAN